MDVSWMFHRDIFIDARMDTPIQARVHIRLISQTGLLIDSFQIAGNEKKRTDDGSYLLTLK